LRFRAQKNPFEHDSMATTNIQSIPVVTPAPPSVEIPVVTPLPEAKPMKTVPPSPPRQRGENPLYTLIAWCARIVTGICMISNVFPLSFITSIAAFGWFQRRIQAIALRGWWNASARKDNETFHDFLASLGDGAPVERPRWFWREHIGSRIEKLARGKSVGGFFKMTWTLVTMPVHSLWLNFKYGIAGLFATYLLTGWGCMIMLTSWHYGWLNSFHKGYEEAFLGLMSGLFAMFILILALLYVPMAQAHQAAAGEIAAFFQFRVVLRLIRARPTAYTILIAGLALTSLVFEIPRLVTLNEDFIPNSEDLSPRQAFFWLEGYWFVCSIFFFISLLVLRTLSAYIYRSAMLKAVRAGTILTSELPPRLMLWFDKLEILPQAQVPQGTLTSVVTAAIGWKYRTFLYSLRFLLLLLFVVRFYVGYFLVYNEYRGVLNHPVVQVPCIDWTPWHLVAGNEE
jgi:hypothetical protein